MATADIFCEPCDQNCLQIPADVWCNECGEGYCHECVKSHKVVKTLRNHLIMSIADHRKIDTPDMCDVCPEHKTVFSLFCAQHDYVLCWKCLQSNHSKCEIVDLAEASKGSKTSTAKENLEKEITATIKELHESIETENSNISSIEKEEESIKTELTEFRTKLVDHIDKLHEQIKLELRDKVQKSKHEMENKKKLLEDTKIKMSDMMQQVETFSKFASEKHAFIAFRQITNTLQEEKKESNAALPEHFEIKFEFRVEKDIQTILNLKSFGEVTISRTNREQRPLDTTESQTIIRTIPTPDINNIRLTKTKSLKVGNDSELISINSCVLMPDGKMVFVDEFGSRLIVHNDDGKHRLDVSLFSLPFDCTATDRNQVALSLPQKKEIAIINTDNGSNIRNFSCSFQCWGLCFAHETLYISDPSNKQVHIMDTSGKQLGQFDIDTSEAYNISIFKDRHFLVDSITNKLCAMSEKGKKMFEVHDTRFRKSFLNWISLTTDSYGNVFVVLRDNKCVTVVSHDGKNTRDILTESDIHQNPSGISFLPHTNQLLLCNAFDKYAALYNVKY